VRFLAVNNEILLSIVTSLIDKKKNNSPAVMTHKITAIPTYSHL